MEFTIKAGDFARAVGIAKACVPTRTTVPILSSVLMTAAKGRLFVRGSSLEMEAEAAAECSVAKDGTWAIQAATLHGILTGFDADAQATLSLSDNDRAKIVVGRSRYQLRCLPGADFPVIPPIGVATKFSIDAVDLWGLIEAVRYACGAGGSPRPYLDGVYLHVSEGHLVSAASDTHRLAQCRIDLPRGAEEMAGVIVPVDAVARMQGILKDAGCEVSVAVSRSAMQVSSPSLRFSTRLLDAIYPPYERLLPPAKQFFARVSADDLAAAVGRALMVYQDTDVRAPQVVVKSGKGELVITAGSHGRDVGTEYVTAETHGEAEMPVNAKYLAELLAKYAGEDIDMQEPSAPGGPYRVSAEARPEQVHIIMPQMKAGG